MMRIVVRATFCIALLEAASACGASNSAGPPRPATPDARQSRTQKPSAPPVLIAPPPAYGNKIVMARSN